MNILAHVHRMPPVFNSGAEWYMLEVLRFLRMQGHQVTAAARDVGHDYEFRDVPVRALKGHRLPELQELYRAADVVLTQLDLTRGATVEAYHAGHKPVVHFIHNERQLKFWGVKPSTAALVCYNSYWLKREVEEIGGDTRFVDRSLVVRPLVRCADYEVDTSRADRLTLINCAENKGAPLVWELARLMPERRFLAVVGSYHEQLRPPDDLRNVELRANGDILPVYRVTRTLLMPSFYESWGRTALEAGASGIPTVAHPTPGLLEALGADGLFAGRLVPEAWVDWIRRLDEPAFRKMMSDAARARAREQERRALHELEELETRLKRLMS